MLTDKEINLLLNPENFLYFTKLFKKKLSGGLLSDRPPNDFNQLLAFLISVKYCFECPFCDRFLYIDEYRKIYNCDCGKAINLNKIEFEHRYVLDNSFYSWFLDYFKMQFNYENKNFLIIIGERIRKEIKHNGKIFIHITPENLWNENFQVIDELYLDNFTLGWKNVIYLFNHEKRIYLFKYIISYREYKTSRRLYRGENKEKYFKRDIINILHLSDFHFDGGPKDNEKGLIIKNIIKDLKKYLLKGKKIHIVIISGDLTKTATKKQFISTTKLLVEKLEDQTSGLGLDRKHIFAIPGNHDINRDHFDKELFKSLTKKYDEKNLQDFWYSSDLSSKLFSNFKKFDNFQFFQEKCLKTSPIHPKKLYINYCLEKDRKKIGFLGLNTVWVGGDDNEKGRLLLSKFQIIDALRQDFNIDENILNIAVLHHPIDSLHEDEQEEVKYLLYNYFNLILYGHRHDTNYTLIEGYGTKTHLIRAGPIYKTKERIRGTYNLIQINLNKRIGRIIFRKPHKTNINSFLNDWEASPKEEDFDKEGIFEFNF